MLLIWILYALSALVACLVGYLCLRGRSTYPDTSTGYHTRLSIRDAESWAIGNNAGGRLSILVGVVAFVVAPAVMAVLDVSMGFLLAAYFVFALIWVLSFMAVPYWLLKRRDK